MIILGCGRRRLKSYEYGWIIEIEKTRKAGKNKGEKYWDKDTYPYPASLEKAFEIVAEREFRDAGDVSLDGVVERLEEVAKSVRKYAKMARTAL